MISFLVRLAARLYRLKLSLLGPMRGLTYRRHKSDFDTNYPFF